MKRHAPATARNRELIAQVLAAELPGSGLVLEVASGSGEHAVHFAQCFPALQWQPSDPDPAALGSIAAWVEEAGLANLRSPLLLDAAAPQWPVERADALFCSNMAHISPWEATCGVFAGAGRLLPPGAPLVLYGPWFEDGAEPAPSNCAFDESLRQRNPQWGIRLLADADELAASRGLRRTGRVAMPANNLTLVYRKV
jgi:hypothetical protein